MALHRGDAFVGEGGGSGRGDLHARVVVGQNLRIRRAPIGEGLSAPLAEPYSVAVEIGVGVGARHALEIGHAAPPDLLAAPGAPVAVGEEERADEVALVDGGQAVGLLHSLIGGVVVGGPPDLGAGGGVHVGPQVAELGLGGGVTAGGDGLGLERLGGVVGSHLVGHDALEIFVHLQAGHRAVGHEHPHRGRHPRHPREGEPLLPGQLQGLRIREGLVGHYQPGLDEGRLSGGRVPGHHLEVQRGNGTRPDPPPDVGHADVALSAGVDVVGARRQGQTIMALCIGVSAMLPGFDQGSGDGLAPGQVRHPADEPRIGLLGRGGCGGGQKQEACGQDKPGHKPRACR